MDQEQMAAWMKYASPGAKHRFLEKLAGSWTAEATFWMQPGAPPMTSKGICENEMILGGRFLRSTLKSEMMNAPFEGMSIDGYDNLNQKYVGIWMDTMGTMMLVFEGSADAAGRVRTSLTEHKDAMTGQMKKMKGVTTIVGDGEHRYEGFYETPDGGWFRTLEVVYRRR